MNWIGPTDVVLYLTVGIALGALYFVLLLKAVRLHASQAKGARIVPLYLLRFVAAISAFWIIAHQGALPLLLALLGFLGARFVVQYGMGSE